MLTNQNPVETKTWPKLEMLFLTMQATHMRELFEEDPDRFNTFHTKFEDILVDYSKNIVNKEVLKELIALANEVDLKGAIDAMYRGEVINQTEQRSVLHVALRN